MMNSPRPAIISCLSSSHPRLLSTPQKETRNYFSAIKQRKENRQKSKTFSKRSWLFHLGLDTRNPDMVPRVGLHCVIVIFPGQTHLLFVVCEQQRCMPACASTQSDQRRCYSLSRKYNSRACCSTRLNLYVLYSSKSL